MAEIKTFRAWRFNEQKVGSFDQVVTPPFDVIDSATRRELEKKSPYNMVRLLLPEARAGLSPYQAAAQDFEAWRREDVLRQDEENSFYLLEQEFQGLDGKRHVRRGFFATAKLPEPGQDRIVLGHERVFQNKVVDRLALTEATQANLGSVFVFYEDPNRALAPFLAQMDAHPPCMEAHTVDGVVQRLWQVPEDPRVLDHFHDRTLYIADGHHRFRTAEEYRDQMRDTHPGAGLQHYDYVLMGFIDIADPGLVVWPTHRLLDPPDGFSKQAFFERIAPWFEVEQADSGLAARVDESKGCTFGLAMQGGGQYLLTLRPDCDRAAFLGSDRSPEWRNLNVAVLHRGILEKVLGLEEGAELTYEPNHGKALARVESGEAGMAFLLKAIPVSQVRDCAEASVFMPEKATYFFPKLPSGAVIHRLV